MASSRLRIVSYNVQVLAQGDRGVIDTLSRLAPDLIGLQEVDQGTTRSQGRSQAKVVAEALGMQYAYAAAMPYAGGEFGVAILSRGEITETRIERLPRGGSEEPRVAVLATCRLADGLTVRFANTHLASDWHTQNPQQVRALQATALAEVLRAEAEASNTPLFLVGDFNADSNSQALASLRSVARPLHTDLQTYPATAPAEALDHVFYIPAASSERYLVEVLSARVEPSTASDHLPLCVELELREPAAGSG